MKALTAVFLGEAFLLRPELTNGHETGVVCFASQPEALTLP